MLSSHSHKVFVSYHVSFIKSHQHGTPVPLEPLPEPVLPPPIQPCLTSVTIKEVPDVDAASPGKPPSVTPRRSTQPSMPSERHCTLDGKPYVSPTQHAVIESLSQAAADHLHALSPAHASEEHALPAIFTEEEFAALADVFAHITVTYLRII
ncbi:hypothetical protein CY34DRAFT_19839 [Suillus luteus UH-Slu-Lm8-n1]|uniref:Uncharacterized protein n=1 Tax=Suillus luteus UH-Slu-Lm8-n1 TaxID=930992 RepID=A0A0C9ZQH4_9AGAM|nr:hypothetical protein CY34DRAFT_19839 [Suillus luteus UH-Slu-Lm8-n1]